MKEPASHSTLRQAALISLLTPQLTHRTLFSNHILANQRPFLNDFMNADKQNANAYVRWKRFQMPKKEICGSFCHILMTSVPHSPTISLSLSLTEHFTFLQYFSFLKQSFIHLDTFSSLQPAIDST